MEKRLKWLSRSRSAPAKVFCVGFGKTGTTSLGAALKMLGFRVGRQAKGERLLDFWAAGEFAPIIQHSRSADAFQDIPFYLPQVYEHLDRAFPASQFILTVRNSSEEWYRSLIRFHMKILRTNTLPTADALKNHRYRYKGWLWRAHELIYEIDEHTLFSKSLYIEKYESHCNHVMEYFKDRSDSLLVLNLSHEDTMKSLCRFLNRPFPNRSMPHLNASRLSAWDKLVLRRRPTFLRR